MSEYTVEVIFEPTGDYMHFTYEAESDNEEDLGEIPGWHGAKPSAPTR